MDLDQKQNLSEVYVAQEFLSHGYDWSKSSKAKIRVSGEILRGEVVPYNQNITTCMLITVLDDSGKGIAKFRSDTMSLARIEGRDGTVALITNENIEFLEELSGGVSISARSVSQMRALLKVMSSYKEGESDLAKLKELSQATEDVNLPKKVEDRFKKLGFLNRDGKLRESVKNIVLDLI